MSTIMLLALLSMNADDFEKISPSKVIQLDVEKAYSCILKPTDDETLFVEVTNVNPKRVTRSFIYDVRAGKKSSEVTLGRFFTIGIASNFKSYASNGDLTSVVIRSIPENKEIMTFDYGRDFTLQGLHLANRGKSLVVIGFNQNERKVQLRIVDVPSGKVVQDVLCTSFGEPDFDVTEDGKIVALATETGASVYGVKAKFDDPIHIEYSDSNKTLRLSPDGKYCAIGFEETAIWQLGEEPKFLSTRKFDSTSFTFDFVPNTPLFAKPRLDFTHGTAIEIRQLNDSKAIARLLYDENKIKRLVRIAFSPNGKHAYALDEKAQLIAWDTATLVEKFGNASSEPSDKDGGHSSETGHVAADGFRNWSNASKTRSIRAKLLSHSGEIVKIQREDGKVFEVPLSYFSKDDQEFVRQATAAAP